MESQSVLLLPHFCFSFHLGNLDNPSAKLFPASADQQLISESLQYQVIHLEAVDTHQ